MLVRYMRVTLATSRDYPNERARRKSKNTLIAIAFVAEVMVVLTAKQQKSKVRVGGGWMGG